MKFKILTVLSLLVMMVSVQSCSKDTCSNGVKDGNETGVDCGGSCSSCGSTNPISGTNSIQINGVAKTLTSAKAILDNKFTASINNDGVAGLGLGLIYTFSDGSTLSVGYYNDDKTQDCLMLGAHTTDLSTAFDAVNFQYAAVIYSSTSGNFRDDGSSSDIVNLNKCDRPNKLFSGDYNLILENSFSDSTISVTGSFVDVSYTVAF